MRIVVVTDHALVRYLERGHGVDVEGLRRRMAEACAPHAPGRLAVAFGGAHLVLDGRVVRTALGTDMVLRRLPEAPR